MPPRQRRVIINTDAKNEADDQFAIVHGLLSPTMKIEGLIAAHFGAQRSATSMQESRDEIDLLLRLLGMTGDVTVANGAPGGMPDVRTAISSEGSRLIVSEAMKDDGPLFVAFLGPLTDMASALIDEPRIQDRDVTVVWIGGPGYDGVDNGNGIEFNLSNDIHSANAVFASRLKILQIPRPVYAMVGVGYAELAEKVEPCGELGAYLVRQLVEWNETWVNGPIEHRSLGDSPAISVILNPHGALWRDRPAPFFNEDGTMSEIADARTIRVCEAVDTRYLLEDMFAKIRSFAGRP